LPLFVPLRRELNKQKKKKEEINKKHPLREKSGTMVLNHLELIFIRVVEVQSMAYS
jgi:hypothetical protein